VIRSVRRRSLVVVLLTGFVMGGLVVVHGAAFSHYAGPVKLRAPGCIYVTDAVIYHDKVAQKTVKGHCGS
jgi:hypothetical protein